MRSRGHGRRIRSAQRTRRRGRESERLLRVIAEGCEVDGPSQAMIEVGEELDHGVDLIGVLRIRKGRDLGFKRFEPWRAHWEIHALPFDLGRLGDRSLNLAEFGLIRTKPLPRALPFDERVANGQPDARRLKDNASGIPLLIHVEDRRLDLMEVQSLAQDVEQVELLSKDSPRRADGVGRGFGVDDRRVPTLHDQFIKTRRPLVALEMLELEQQPARRRRPLQDLRVIWALAEVPEQLLECGPVEPLLEQKVARVEDPRLAVSERRPVVRRIRPAFPDIPSRHRREAGR